MLYCDIEWTGEAVGNIVKNALDHTDAGGKITISWERTPAMIRIFITDNGHGIAQRIYTTYLRGFTEARTLQAVRGLDLDCH